MGAVGREGEKSAHLGKEIKATMRFTPTRMAVIDETDKNKCPGCGEIGTLTPCSRGANWCSALEKSLTVPQKLIQSYHKTQKYRS